MSSPLAQLLADRAAAQAADDRCAPLCTLATVDEHGAPQARTLVLRVIDEALGLFINATSPKQRQLASGAAQVCTYYPSIEVQYRLSCQVRAMPEDLVHSSWQARPDVPKRMDWFYLNHQVQSSAIDSREALTSALAQGPTPAEPPPTAVGYWLDVQTLERLALGMPDGVHDRRRWQLQPQGGWLEEVLVP